MGPNIAEKFILGGTNFREVQIKRDRPFIKFIMMHVFALVSAYTCADLCDMCNSTEHLLLQFWLLSSSCCNGQLEPQLHLLSWYRQDLLLQTTVSTYQKEVNGTKDIVSTEQFKTSFACILILILYADVHVYHTMCEL